MYVDKRCNFCHTLIILTKRVHIQMDARLAGVFRYLFIVNTRAKQTNSIMISNLIIICTRFVSREEQPKIRDFF